jgi:heme-degrading monooxygenase HmoA
MTVMMIAELPGTTTAQYDQVNEKLGIRGPGDEPEGLIQHVAGDTGDGLLIVDVWESQEAFERFFGEGGAAQAIAEVGAPPVEPRIMPVHNMIRRGAGTQENVFLVIDAEGFSPELYDDLITRMPAHAGDGSAHPAVSHVAAKSDDGMVFVDVWDSPESFQRFAEEQLASAAPDMDMAALQPRFVPLHNRFAR